MRALARRVPGARALVHQTSYLLSLLRDLREGPEAMTKRSLESREWDFASPASRDRNRRVLDVVGARIAPGEWGDALEVGCADGIFTAELARRCRSVAAFDVSDFARARAEERCAGFAHVEIGRLDLVRDPIPGHYDLVFAMDVLDLVHGRRRLAAVLDRLLGSVRVGGLLLLTACRVPETVRRAWWSRWLPEGADNIMDFAAGRAGLHQLHREFHPAEAGSIPGYLDHVIALFEKRAAPSAGACARESE